MKLSQYINHVIANSICQVPHERLDRVFVWAEKRGILDGAVVRLSNGALCLLEDAGLCHHCKEFHHIEDLEVVKLDFRRTVDFCPECAHYRTFLCERTGRRYYDFLFTPVEVEGETVCYEECRDLLYGWESTDSYHWEPEPAHLRDY